MKIRALRPEDRPRIEAIIHSAENFHPADIRIALELIDDAISKKESEVANLRQRYKSKHPKMIQAESELAEWRSNLQKAVLNVPQTIRNGYESAKAAELASGRAPR